MSDRFELVKEYLFEMGLPITEESVEEQLVVVDHEEDGIKNLVIDCEEEIVILEQAVMAVPAEAGNLFQKLLQMNRSLIHGAFALDDDAKLIIWRDTLQLENLDRNELEGSIRALGLAMAENSTELLSHAGK